VSQKEATAELLVFAQQAASALSQDQRVQVVWLTGSLAAGTADACSDVDLRIAVTETTFAKIATNWKEFIEIVAPTVWQRRWPGSPDQAVLGAITTDYLRFDVVVQSITDTMPRKIEAAQVLFDRHGDAGKFQFDLVVPINPYSQLPVLVEEFIRLVGMLPIVVGRNDTAIGMEGQMGLHSMLLSLLLLENGIDRMSSGKRHVEAHLTAEQRVLLSTLPPLAPTLQSVIEGRVAYARLFFPRAKALMEAQGLVYPQSFEDATRHHLKTTLGIEL
jgi:predicted nucleotidyltransferase